MKTDINVHLMTAALAPGDAVGNHVLILRQLLTEFGCRVMLYADWISPDFSAPAYPSRLYRATGQSILWYQYSIGTDNLSLIEPSIDYKIMDFHGVSPARLFAGYAPKLERLCRQGEEMLPQLCNQFDLCIAHSDYSRQLLEQAGYDRVETLPLVVEPKRDNAVDDVALVNWLNQLEYILFVGRVVPQKDILSMLNFLVEVHTTQPEAVLIIVGRRDMALGYQREIDRAIDKLGLARRVLFLGQVNDASTLASLYRHARFTLIMSEWESFCVPAVESMHFGTPVVAHRVPPLPEVIANGGIVIDKHQLREAAQSIKNIWHDGVEREQLRQAARARAQDFTIEKLRQQLLSMLQRVFA